MIKKLKFIYGKNRLLGTLMITIYAAGILPVSFSSACIDETQQNTFTMNGELSSLSSADAWINSSPLTKTELEGKVVLIEFCTYTCINWLRTMPYVRAWSEKYKSSGLVVIGVHTPEFPFEKNIDNVRRAIGEMNISIPIAIDNNYTIWSAFSNQYWPALYFIDAKGRIRHTKFGEGGYEESEKMIQQLLMEAGNEKVSRDIVSPDDKGIEAAADWSNLNSQENYLGHERTENFSSGKARAFGNGREYSIPSKLKLNHWALSGNWTSDKNSIALNKANGKIVYRFHARDVHLVMGPASPGTIIRIHVLVDGRSPGEAHGLDVDEQGYGTVKEQRLYQLIRQQSPVIDREIEIEFLDAGAEAFSFTFG